MDRIDALRAFGDAERTDPSAETVINSAPYRPAKAIFAAQQRRSGRLTGKNTCASMARTWMSG